VSGRKKGRKDPHLHQIGSDAAIRRERKSSVVGGFQVKRGLGSLPGRLKKGTGNPGRRGAKNYKKAEEEEEMGVVKRWGRIKGKL